MGITDTVVRAAPLAVAPLAVYVGLTVVQLEHSSRRADREHQRRAREQVGRRSDEVVRMALGAGARPHVAFGVVSGWDERGERPVSLLGMCLLQYCTCTEPQHYRLEPVQYP